MGNGNSFKFFGSFDGYQEPGTNPIAGFTFGLGPYTQFDSWTAQTLQSLLEKIKSGVEQKNEDERVMFLHIQDNRREVWKMKNFNFYNGRKEKKFSLFIHADNAKHPGTIVTFYDVQVKSNFKGAGLQLITLNLSNDHEVTGDKA